jgi:hypothetical protein
MELKAALDPATILPGSCVSTWDFAYDPCQHVFSEEAFSCGITCTTAAAAAGEEAEAEAGEGEEEGEEGSEGGDDGGRRWMQRITAVKLEAAGYGGALSAAVGRLEELEALEMAGNRLGGEIPGAVSHLGRLEVLDLSRNGFSGGIPRGIFGPRMRRLRSVNLAGNRLSGPWELEPMNNTSSASGGDSSPSSLVELRMYDNELSGAIPAGLSGPRFGALRVLDVSGNAFSGPLPRGLPPAAVSVSMKGNRLTGAFTRGHVDGLGRALAVLDLSGNALSGPLDAALFAHPALQQLNLSHNAFTRIIVVPDPDNDGNATVGVKADDSSPPSQMVAIDLSYNRISGRLPTLFAGMERLASLSLSHNAFRGRIAAVYAVKALAAAVGLEPLRRLMLDGNFLRGPLPPLFLRLLPADIVASFADNCLANCSDRLFFCRGGPQKPDSVCRAAALGSS